MRHCFEISASVMSTSDCVLMNGEMDPVQIVEFVKLAAIGPLRSCWANGRAGLKRAGAASNGRQGRGASSVCEGEEREPHVAEMDVCLVSSTVRVSREDFRFGP